MKYITYLIVYIPRPEVGANSRLPNVHFPKSGPACGSAAPDMHEVLILGAGSYFPAYNRPSIRDTLVLQQRCTTPICSQHCAISDGFLLQIRLASASPAIEINRLLPRIHTLPAVVMFAGTRGSFQLQKRLIKRLRDVCLH